MPFSGKAILLDIEGTTSSVAYVFDVLFPYVRRHLEAYLQAHRNETSVEGVCEQLARESGAKSFSEWAGDATPDGQRAKVAAEVNRLMDKDVKSTGLKELQGLIWKKGFESGELRAHVFPDVPPALRRWRKAGLDVRIYSSGSSAAQKLFFAHSEFGDLVPFLNGHFDTTTGPKKDPNSYRKIAAEFRLQASEILFVSDIVAELDAAKEAGFATVLSIRPGNAPVGAEHGHPRLETFDEISTP
ncbi:MAG: acireductone synthase [Planctomycetes bacterium]|nr:acireductone synthase [Planctomycetota bacterium]